MASYQSFDFFKLDDHLSKDEIRVREDLREFVGQSIVPIVEDHYHAGSFPTKLIKEFARLKVLGATIKGYGCAGVNDTTYGLMMQEVERGDSGLRSFCSVQGALCMYPISAYASEEVKKQYLPAMASGDLIGCFGLTEPDVGSNPSNMKTRLTKDGSGFRLTGHKKWLTNGTMAGIGIIWAKDDDGKVRGVIVDLKSTGVEVREIKNKHSLRVSPSAEILFHEVKVPNTHILNVTGLKGPFSCLNNARFGIAWGVLGAMSACLDEAISYTKNRQQFSTPLAGHQMVQAKLVEIFTDFTLGQMLAFHLGRLKDKGEATPEQISMAKMHNVSRALKAARLCRDMLGANGILSDYQCMRHMCNLETVNTYEGTEDIHRLVLGKYLTDIAAF